MGLLGVRKGAFQWLWSLAGKFLILAMRKTACSAFSRRRASHCAGDESKQVERSFCACRPEYVRKSSGSEFGAMQLKDLVIMKYSLNGVHGSADSSWQSMNC